MESGKIQAKGIVVIPLKLREKYKINVGDVVIFGESHGKITMKKINGVSK